MGKGQTKISLKTVKTTLKILTVVFSALLLIVCSVIVDVTVDNKTKEGTHAAESLDAISFTLALPNTTYYSISTAQGLYNLHQLITKGCTYKVENGTDKDGNTKYKEVTTLYNFSGKTIELTKDINLSGVNFTPIGDTSHPFCGTFDGKNKIIKNLKIDGVSYENIGLFGMVESATIKNVYVKDCNCNGNTPLNGIGSSGSVSGLVGWVTNGVTITNCMVTGSLSGKVDYVGGIIGGAVGGDYVSNTNNPPILITNCSVLASIKSDNLLTSGGILGGIHGNSGGIKVSISNCFYYGKVTLKLFFKPRDFYDSWFLSYEGGRYSYGHFGGVFGGCDTSYVTNDYPICRYPVDIYRNGWEYEITISSCYVAILKGSTVTEESGYDYRAAICPIAVGCSCYANDTAYTYAYDSKHYVTCSNCYYVIEPTESRNIKDYTCNKFNCFQVESGVPYDSFSKQANYK